MPEKPIDIQIFGRTLRINCPPHQKDALNKAVQDLTKRLHDLKIKTKVTNSDQLIFITALNICHELAQEKLKTVEYILHVKKCLLEVQQTVEKALTTHDNLTERSNLTLEYSKHT
ncbi:cell division protein ZapA [Candidatus Blochmanniella vafra str. BVAF]|uniref:Cell division protein ZapA n=1 Tax=Blochmanniella vafra (strain BVAF) TaxID=859654 RepID=E8Q642_BLOVB|nr:cell division protein ZapA [Candidatus Blochmannia vafer]ADV33658.1 cell division protein ZapA [Candidatus Blochmannia vafer str. BVAF]